MSGKQTRFAEPGAFEVVAIGASAGGPRSILRILEELPADLPAAVVVAQHRPLEAGDLLVQLLRFRSRLPVKHPEQGESVCPGTVYVAPPGRHVEITPQKAFCVRRTERINFVRPSIDLLFHSLAENFGARAIGVVLSGTGADGAHGIRAIREQGGFTITQDETTATYFEMPNAAIETAKVDLVLPLHRISLALTLLIDENDRAIQQASEPGPIGREYRVGLKAACSSRTRTPSV